MSSTTLVTALYNIGRENLTGKHSHRSFTKYLNWFKYLLHINVPMVIFIPEELHSYILEHRIPNFPTKIIIRNFEELAAYKNYHDRIQNTINLMIKEPDANGKIPQYFNECPEFITAKYETIIFSKFDFLKEVADENPYNTDYFIWLDAGTFYQDPPFDSSLPWPDPYKIKILGDKFLVSNYYFNVHDVTPLNDKRSYLRLNKNEICAYILGGTKIAINRIHSLFWDEVENALNMGVINNEQHILQLMLLEHPKYYYIWYRTRYQYPTLPIPLCDRMIPCELAIGTFIGEHYPINPNIKLLTIATREISKSAYEKWEKTAQHYGYDYEIIGQDTSWKGFGTKLKLYYQKLQTVTEPYTVIADCTDLFFCGSSDELYDKFINYGKDLIVGGELELYYPGGKYNKNLLTSYFQLIKESPQSYPNSGFIMGTTESVRKLMEINQEYHDDQVACIDTIYENKIPLAIDYKTSLIGNIPNYGENTYKSVGYFKFDPKLRRYRNFITGEAPVALHFSGKNYHIMQQFYNNQSDILMNQPDSNATGWIFLGIFILIIILIIIIYIVPIFL